MGEVGLYSRDIAVVDAVAPRGVAEDRLRERPSLYGPVRISSESPGREHNRVAGALRTATVAEPLAVGDLPVRVPESGLAGFGRWRGHSTRWRAPSETPAPSRPIPRHGSSRRPTRPGGLSGTITIHSPKGQGTTVRRALDLVPREPAYRLQWSSRPVVSARSHVRSPLRLGQQVDQGGLDRLSRRKRPPRPFVLRSTGAFNSWELHGRINALAADIVASIRLVTVSNQMSRSWSG